MTRLRQGIVALLTINALARQAGSGNSKTGICVEKSSFLGKQFVTHWPAKRGFEFLKLLQHADTCVELPLNPSVAGSTRLGVPSKAQIQSNPLETLAFSKGDYCKTIDAFRQAVGQDYTVYHNQLATKPEQFCKRVIMIYGEIHDQIKIPGIRNQKGLLLLESHDPNLRLVKHQKFASNQVHHIDLLSEAEQGQLFRPLIQALTELIDRIDPNAMDALRRTMKPADSGHTMLQNMLTYADEHYDDALKRKVSWEKDSLVYFHDRVVTEYERVDQKIEESRSKRDIHMATRAIGLIEQLKEDESVTMIVGALHVKCIAETINVHCGAQMPIVVCQPKVLRSDRFRPEL